MGSRVPVWTLLHVLNIPRPTVAVGTSVVSFPCPHKPETFSAETTLCSTVSEAAHSSEYVLAFFFFLRTSILNVVTVKN